MCVSVSFVQENVMKLFETQRQSSDEFTKWCEDSLAKFQAGIDGKCQISFLSCHSTLEY